MKITLPTEKSQFYSIDKAPVGFSQMVIDSNSDLCHDTFLILVENLESENVIVFDATRARPYTCKKTSFSKMCRFVQVHTPISFEIEN